MSAFNLGDIFVKFKAKVEGFGDVTKSVAEVGDKVKATGDKVGAFGDKADAAGKKMSVGLTAPLVAFGAVAFKSAASFEQTMTQVRVATGASADSMKNLSSLAEEMGAKTKFSAGEAAEAMLELAKGGITEAQIKAGALDATMTLAAAGGLALGDAAGYVSNALNTFGLKAEDAGAVAAALAGGANASTASVESLGQALSQVGPGAKLAGYSLQDTVAVLAAFDNAGVKGSDAGTSLKTMLMGLNPQTKEAAEQMKKLGLKFTDAQGKFVPMREVAEQLKSKLSGLSDAQKQSALQTMFGTDAYRAAAILMNEGAAGVDKYTAATSDLGAAQEMANAMTSGSAGKMEMMMGSLETATKKVGDAIAPTVVKVAETIGKLADKFTKLDPKIQGFVVMILGIVAAAGPVLIIIGKIAKGIQALTKVFQVLSKISLLTNPWFLALLAVAALAYIIYRNWDTLKQWFGTFWEFIKGVFSAAFNWIVDNWQLVISLLLGPIGMFIALVISHFDKIKAFIIGVFAFIVDAVLWYINLWISYLQLIWMAIQWVFSTVWAIIVGAFNMITGFIGMVIQGWINIISAIVGVVSAVFGAVWNVISGILSRIGGFFRSVWDGLFGALKSVGEGIKNTISGIMDTVKGTVKGAINWVIDKVNWAIRKVNSTAGKVPGVPNLPEIPQLASGGIVSKATLAVIGEGSEPEAVVPLSKTREFAQQMGVIGDGGGAGVKVNINGAFARSDSELVDMFEQALELVDRRRQAQGKPAIMKG